MSYSNHSVYILTTYGKPLQRTIMKPRMIGFGLPKLGENNTDLKFKWNPNQTEEENYHRLDL